MERNSIMRINFIDITENLICIQINFTGTGTIPKIFSTRPNLKSIKIVGCMTNLLLKIIFWIFDGLT